MNNSAPITYKKKLGGRTILKLLRSIFFPIGAFVLTLLAVNVYGDGFGKNIIGLFVSIMWGVSIILAFIFPSQRDTIIKEVLVVILIYTVGLMGLREVILAVSGVTTQTLMASFGQQIPQSSGNAALGWLQTSLWIFSILVPIGFLGYQVKRLLNFRRMTRKTQFMEQKRNLIDKRQGF